MNCNEDKHKPRNNRFGVTWCVNCGRLFTKPCDKDLLQLEIKNINLSKKQENDKESI